MKLLMTFILFAFLPWQSDGAPLVQKQLSFKNCKDCNLIIISLTSLRKKNMSFYGYKRPTTPNIEKFFNNSFVFQNVMVPGTLTFTDAMSLFYSLSPQVHRAFVRNRKQYTHDILKSYNSLASILEKNGYTTAAFVSDEDYDFDWGLGSTFQLYFDRSKYADYGISFKPFSYSVGTKQLVPIASEWLQKNANKKKFMFLQAYDLHCPFSPEGEFQKLYQMPHSKDLPFDKECFMAKEKMVPLKKDGKTKFLLESFFSYLDKTEKSYYFEKRDIDYLISRYDAELTQADYNLNALFKKIEDLKLDKNSIIVFLTEHGDYQGENGYFFKTSATAEGNLHNANLVIPLMIKAPGLKQRQNQKQLIQLIDVAPSLLDMLEIKPDPRMQGKTFKDVLQTQKEINDYQYAYSVRYDFSPDAKIIHNIYELESLQDHRWKLDLAGKIQFPKKKLINEQYYLFDLKSDPDEKKDIFSKNSQIGKDLIKKMKEKKNFYSGLKK